MKKGEQKYIISSLLRVLKIVLRSDVATHKQENGGGGGGRFSDTFYLIVKIINWGEITNYYGLRKRIRAT